MILKTMSSLVFYNCWNIKLQVDQQTFYNNVEAYISLLYQMVINNKNSRR